MLVDVPLKLNSLHNLDYGKEKIFSNKIFCDDFLNYANYIDGENIFDLCIADPPYNIGKDFHDGGNDNLMISQYVEWSLNWINATLKLIKPSAPIYIYGFPEILAHIAVHLPINKQRWLVWHYTNKTTPSSNFWQRSHESILCIWKSEKPKLQIDQIREPYTETFLNNSAGKIRKNSEGRFHNSNIKETIYQAHENGALPRDIIKVSALAGGAGLHESWFYCYECDDAFHTNNKAKHKNHTILKHPTQKPIKISETLIKSAIKLNSNGKVLIPFSGSGSECVAAKMCGAVFTAFELEEKFIKITNRRLEECLI